MTSLSPGETSDAQPSAPAPGPGRSSEPLPAVSLIVCVLNEARHVEQAIRHVLDQDYQGPLELIVALGPSRDDTDAIVAGLAADDPRIRVIRNPSPKGTTPAGLNAAIAASSNEIVVRLDGHAMLPPDYVRVAVETIRRTGADNVGGVMAAEGRTPFERAVARAMTSRLGVGDSSFHTGGTEGPADTVYLGAFRRETLVRVGGYDENFLRAQDWEMNLRIRRTGGLVWFQPAMRVQYKPRARPRDLARQYFQYGRWRRVVMRRHGGTASVRYLAAPLTLVALVAGSVVGVLMWWPALVLPTGYVSLLLVGSVVEGHDLPGRSAAWLPVVFATMHLSWASGFLLSPRSLARRVVAGSTSGGTRARSLPGR